MLQNFSLDILNELSLNAHVICYWILSPSSYIKEYIYFLSSVHGHLFYLILTKEQKQMENQPNTYNTAKTREKRKYI